VKIRFKKISALFFITLGLIPVFFMLVVAVKRQHIRHEMKEKMEERLLHSVTLQNSGIVWVKAEKEIVIEGRMFDVKRYETKNGITVFTGLYDEEETALNGLLDNEWQKGQGKFYMQLFQLLQNVFFQPAENKNAGILSANKIPPLTNNKPVEIFSTVTAPPPKC
jgi:hypothetical protein